MQVKEVTISGSSQQDVSIRDRFSEGKPLWARAFAQSCSEFGPIELRIISGQIPASLRGTFYQNGPGLLERGNQRPSHWFSGDGGILAVHFTDTGATGLYRYVKTAGFQAEQKKGRFLYPDFYSDKTQFWWSRRKNPANTSVIAVQDKLLALWEMGHPHALDPDTLETLGLDNLGILTKNQAFSAHPKQDSQTRDIYNFGVSYRYAKYKIVPQLNLFHCDATGQIRRQAEIPLKRFGIIHDFALAGRYLIFFVPPVQIDVLRLALGMNNFSEAIQWQPELGTEVIIVDRETFQEVGRYETEPWFQWHIGNSYVEKDGTLVINFVRYPHLGSIGLPAEIIPTTSTVGKLWRIRINPQNGRLIENIQILDRVCEFPVVSPFVAGSKARYLYVSSGSPVKAKTESLFTSIACVDTETGKATFADLGQGCYLTESIYAPDKFAPNQGWILSVVFDGNQDQSTLHIYNAEKLDSGPVCVLELPHIVPFGFHGTWRIASTELIPVSNTNNTCSIFPMIQSSNYRNLQASQPRLGRVAIVGAVAALATGGVITYGISRFASTSQSPVTTPVNSIPEVRFVTALGRLEPKGEVIKLSAPAAADSAFSSRVDQLLVKQGDKVQTGQVVAILNSRAPLLAALEKAKGEVRVAKARLAQVKAGAKAGEINAQAATIARIEAEQRGQITAAKATVVRLEAELRNAQTEYQRYESLYQNGAIAVSNRDSKRLTVETVTQQLNEAKANLKRIKQAQWEQLNEAKATLNRIAEVRPVDVQAAEAEVSTAEATVKGAQANLDLAYVRATRDGQILKIHTWPGEVVSNQGIVELGQTDQMYVVAEVYETDIGKVRVGQQATITSSAFAGQLQGTVDEIGMKISKKDVLNTDPTADTDARVVEVKIRLNLEASRKVASLTNLQVKAVIKL